MTELECKYVLSDAGAGQSIEGVLRFKKMLLDTFFIIVNNTPQNRWKEFGNKYESLVKELVNDIDA